MIHPNFFIIGAARCGTTSLFSYLRQHPQVFMPEHKEPFTMAFKNGNFINDDPKSFPYQKTYRELLGISDYDKYLELFQKATHEKAIGEASTMYIHSLYACENIKQLYPNAKLIVSLRNPVDQIHSSYYFALRKIKGIERGNDIETLENLIRNQNEEFFQHFDAAFYCKHLKPYYDKFPKKNIHVILFEDFVKNTKSVLKGVFQYLEIDAGFEPEIKVQNRGAQYKNARLNYLLNKSAFVLKAKELIKHTTPRVFNKKFLALIWYIDKFNSEKPPPLSQETRAHLLSIMREDIDNLQSLIGCDLSQWS
jgi:hypothetical protein